MKCIQCKKTIPESSLLCPFCGSAISEEKSVLDFGDIADTDYDKKFDIKTYVKEPKNKKIILVGASVILFVLLLLVFLIVFFVKSVTKKEVPSALFSNTVEELFSYLEENVIGSNVKREGNYELEYVINGKKSRFKGIYELDVKSKIMSLTGIMQDPKENEGGIIIDTLEFSFESYLTGNTLYFKSPQVYDKTVLFPIEDEIGFLTTKNYDISVLINGIEEALIESLKQVNYQDKIEEINYLGNLIKVNKRFIEFDNQVLKKFVLTFYNTLKEDANFLNEMARLQNKKADEIKKILENYSTTAEYKYNGDSEIKKTFSIYYNKRKIYRIAFDDKETKKSYVFDIGENKYYFDSYLEDKNTFSSTISITKKETDDLIFNTYVGTIDRDNEVIDFTLSLEDNKQPKINKKEYEGAKSIRDFQESDYTLVKNNLSVYTQNVLWVDRLDDIFKNKCTPELVCSCEEGEETCNCTYNHQIIKCPKAEIGR